MEEIQIKRAVRAGNSSAIILPKSWLNKEVRFALAKKNDEKILAEVLLIIKNQVNLGDVIGIYLTGSYARGEEDKWSDIDILVVTNNINKEIIHDGIYNILIVSLDLLGWKLKNDLLPIGQMISEAKALLNSDFLASLQIKVTRKNVSWYIETSRNKLEMLRQVIKIEKRRNRKYIDDRVIYTLVLRIRTLYVIRNLMHNKRYSKKDFIHLIELISHSRKAYERYLAVKNNEEHKSVSSLEEAERMYLHLKEQLEIVRRELR